MKINFFNSDWLKEFVRQFFSLIKEISKPTKLTGVTIFVLFAFWYLSIYLIDRHFYDKNPIWTTALISFVSSISWLCINVIIVSVFAALIPPLLDKIGFELEKKEEMLIVSSGVNSIIYLSIVLLYSYHKKVAYFDFLINCSFYVAFAFVYLLYLLIVSLRQNKK